MKYFFILKASDIEDVMKLCRLSIFHYSHKEYGICLIIIIMFYSVFRVHEVTVLFYCSLPHIMIHLLDFIMTQRKTRTAVKHLIPVHLGGQLPFNTNVLYNILGYFNLLTYASF